MTIEIMELNKETAMRLWNKSFGKSTKVTDFAGRTMAKGAYNDRNSEFGWNIDHIYPQSKGGKTADHNLICCNILTNDEKADKFPAFKANGVTFEIIKVENHYEIRKRDKSSNNKPKVENDDSVNFYDSASGVRFFKKLKGIQNKPRFTGSALIKLSNVRDSAVIDFIERFFDKENVECKSTGSYLGYYGSNYSITVTNPNMPYKDNIQEFLDKCILINTYLSYYFAPMDYVDSYDIYCGCDSYDSNEDFYDKNNTNSLNSTISYVSLNNSLYINELIFINTDAKLDEPNLFGNGVLCTSPYRQYNCFYTKLAKNLEKEVSRN